MIDENIKSSLFKYLGGICKDLDCYPIQVGGYLDHVHILCLLSKKITQSNLLESLKRQSSKWIKTKGSIYSNFYWQNGYGIFSVNPSNIYKVKNYIITQENHHKKKTFKDEYRLILKNNDVEYDEQYLWD
jgi:putative transposase